MTANQIAYFRAQEDRRHNMVSEVLSKYNTDRNYQANIYGTDKSYAASIYSSDTHLAGTKYAADQSRAASQYSADRHLEGTIYSADQSKAASMYAADQSRAASEYAANKNYEANIRKAALSLEGTKYSADRNYSASIQTNASKERIATADRIARANVDRANRELKDKQFAADYELRKYIAESEAKLRNMQVFKDATIAVGNAWKTVSSMGEGALGLLGQAARTIV